ncbi:galactokinase [Rhodococcus sp. ARC_M6]|uniref:galactokinase n=1 Tax=Rhodococcus sp. ARC_M6 TaxID=2928852 RepID=UPI001FB2B50C|nr:galactokinase [Rhodococcus sp. ARC_M6]MCJ0905791.1 galactokinase [Rhodococcus sp. ARC_M6]
MNSLKSTVQQSFYSTFGYQPTGAWSAPGRVNLIGEHTDYNAGLCLPIALEHRTYVAAALRADNLVRIHSQQSATAHEGDCGTIGHSWAAYPTAVLWALGFDNIGIDLYLDSSVPVGAGLSSSAALTCSVALTVNELHGNPFSRHQLAEACIRAENEGVGAPTGGMDQTIALFARPATALLLDCRDNSTEHIPFDLPSTGFELIVIDTGVKHSLADGQYGVRRAQCADAAHFLGVSSLREATLDQVESLDDAVLRSRARHVVSENERVRGVGKLLRENRVSEIGPLLDSSHASLRDDFEVSCPELDAAVEAARLGGAVGARMTGGGFGGSAIALAPVGKFRNIRQNVVDAYTRRSLPVPRFFHATPSGPAHRD